MESNSPGRSGPSAAFYQYSDLSADQARHGDFVITVAPHELYRAVEEPRHLITEPRPLPVDAPAAIVHTEAAHELVQRPTEDQFAALRSHRLSTGPGQEQARNVAVGQPRRHTARLHDERVWTVLSDVLRSLARIRPRQRAQGHQARHEAKIRLRFAGLNELVGLA